MKRTAAALVAGSAVLFSLALSTPPAAADERVCRGTLGAVTVDNVKVPTGATCILSRTYVKGQVTFQRGATLDARSARIVGNVQAEGHRNVNGNLQRKENSPAPTGTANRVQGNKEDQCRRL